MTRLIASALILSVLNVIAGCSTQAVPEPDASRNGPRAATDGPAEATSTEAADVGHESPDYFLLIAPLRSSETYLLNADKEVVHVWRSKYPPMGTAYLLPNGDLLRGARNPDYPHFSAGGVGGIVERYNWEGELIWTFQYADESHCLHHDIAPMPNGNILMVAWERKSKEEAIAQGRDPELLDNDLWPDFVIEVQPEGASGGEIVWQWHMWDHLVQDFEREKPNYGIIYEHPELIDLNNTGSTPPATPEELRKLRAVGYTGGGDDNTRRRTRADWMHTNSIDYNPELDQIALSAKNFSEIWIIDHSTTTEEAASHRGGNHGMGGDLLYRWGNPWSYKSGAKEDKKLFDQHDVRWIPPGFPGAGNLTAFNNGTGREYSSIIEINPPLDPSRGYILDDDGRFGPQELAWEYTAENEKDFYSHFISGASRLPNGNTIICEGSTGRVFEVTPDGKTEWEFVNPYGGELTREGRPNDVQQQARLLAESRSERSVVDNNALFRATKFYPDYPGLAGKQLAPLAEQPIPFAVQVQEALARLKAAEGEEPAADGDEPTAEGEELTAEGDEPAADGEEPVVESDAKDFPSDP